MQKEGGEGGTEKERNQLDMAVWHLLLIYPKCTPFSLPN